MSHLSLETLARIVDEEPAPGESAHLEACEACRTELETLREDVHALGLLPELSPPPDAWPALERRLAGEGLLRRAPAGRAPAFTRIMQLAAAVVLFLGGSLAGRMTAEPQTLAVADEPVGADAPVQSANPAGEQRPGPAEAATDADSPRYRPPAYDAPEPAIERDGDGLDRNGDVRLASDAFARSDPLNAAEAAALLRQAEDLYLAALTRYAEIATQSEAGDPVARLAALQSIVMTTQAALHEAPTDPVINGYHLTALAQRDATLAQVTADASERWY